MVGVRIKNSRDSEDYLARLKELEDFESWPESRKEKLLRRSKEGIQSLRITLQLDHLSKEDDVAGGIDWFRKNKESPLSASHICALLRLVSESESTNREIFKEMLDVAFQLPKKNEGIFSLGVRGYSNWGDYKDMLMMFQKMKENAFKPRLRTFTPVIVCLAENCSIDDFDLLEKNYIEMIKVLRAADIDLTQVEYTAMFKGLVRLNSDCVTDLQKKAVGDLFNRTLLDLGSENLVPSDEIHDVLKIWFGNKGYGVKEHVTKKSEDWKDVVKYLHQKRLTEEESNLIKKNIDTLVNTRADLAKEWKDFKQHVTNLAARNPGSKGFDVIIDAANIAYFRQNYNGGRFRFKSVAQITDLLDQMGLNWLIIIHQSHMSSRDLKTNEDRQIVEDWKRKNRVQFVQRKHNDDWYWLYTALYFGFRGTVVVSNDEMRDHHFMMLRQKIFQTWRRNHQVFFDSGYDKKAEILTDIGLKFPSKYALNAQVIYKGIKLQSDDDNIAKNDNSKGNWKKRKREEAKPASKKNSVTFIQGPYEYHENLDIERVFLPRWISDEKKIDDALPGHKKKLTEKAPNPESLEWTCFLKN